MGTKWIIEGIKGVKKEATSHTSMAVIATCLLLSVFAALPQFICSYAQHLKVEWSALQN